MLGVSALVRGDVNNDARIDIADAIWAAGALFGLGPAPTCEDAADVNDDGFLDLSDAVYMIFYQLLGGPSPSAPFLDCGVDETTDELICLESALCAP